MLVFINNVDVPSHIWKYKDGKMTKKYTHYLLNKYEILNKYKYNLEDGSIIIDSLEELKQLVKDLKEEIIVSIGDNGDNNTLFILIYDDYIE